MPATNEHDIAQEQRDGVRFLVNTGRRWTRAERWYMVIVMAPPWMIMPFYFINSGTYLNWPSVREQTELVRSR